MFSGAMARPCWPSAASAGDVRRHTRTGGVVRVEPSGRCRRGRPWSWPERWPARRGRHQVSRASVSAPRTMRASAREAPDLQLAPPQERVEADGRRRARADPWNVVGNGLDAATAMTYSPDEGQRRVLVDGTARPQPRTGACGRHAPRPGGSISSAISSKGLMDLDVLVCEARGLQVGQSCRLSLASSCTVVVLGVSISPWSWIVVTSTPAPPGRLSRWFTSLSMEMSLVIAALPSAVGLELHHDLSPMAGAMAARSRRSIARYGDERRCGARRRLDGPAPALSASCRGRALWPRRCCCATPKGDRMADKAWRSAFAIWIVLPRPS